jgi:hypothetical protein
MLDLALVVAEFATFLVDPVFRIAPLRIASNARELGAALARSHSFSVQKRTGSFCRLSSEPLFIFPEKIKHGFSIGGSKAF